MGWVSCGGGDGCVLVVVQTRTPGFPGSRRLDGCCSRVLGAQLRASLVAAPILTKSLKLAEVNGRVLSVESHKRGSRIVLGNLNIEGLDADATPTKVRITVSGKSEIQPGDVVSVRAGLRPPPRPASPNAFDFARGAYFEGYAGGGLRHWHSEAVASNSRPYGPTD